MNEVTYLPQVKCEVSKGFLQDEITVAVEDVNGKKQFLSVHRKFVDHDNGDAYLPVGIVKVERSTQRVLIELPLEADSGANRLWVPFASFRKE